MYAILTPIGARAIDFNGKLTPVFKYPVQANRYIQKHCGNSRYLNVVEVE